MVTCEQSINNFKLKMEELINAKYILADNKVSGVLKTISDSTLLYQIFEHVTTDFDYQTFKSVCLIENAEDGEKFSLPKREQDILAFGFLFLFEIDGGIENLFDVCNKYFPSSDGKQSSYKRFTEEFLIPFMVTTERVAYKVLSGESLMEAEELEKAKVGEETENESPKIEKTTAQEMLEEGRGKAVDLMLSDKKRTEEYEEVVFVIDMFIGFINKKDMEGITLAFTALKYMTKQTKKIKLDVNKLANVLAEVI